MLASELLLALLHLFSLKKLVSFSWNAWQMILKPTILLLMSIGIYYAAAPFLPFGQMHVFLKTSLEILLVSGLYGSFLLLFHVV